MDKWTVELTDKWTGEGVKFETGNLSSIKRTHAKMRVYREGWRIARRPIWTRWLLGDRLVMIPEKAAEVKSGEA